MSFLTSSDRYIIPGDAPERRESLASALHTNLRPSLYACEASSAAGHVDFVLVPSVCYCVCVTRAYNLGAVPSQRASSHLKG
eukprot:724794-Prymnesium_polylepis.2